MALSLSLVTFLVRDYDEAIAYFTQTLGFVLVEDTVISPKKRRCIVAATPSLATGMLLAKTSSSEQEQTLGNQCRGRVAFFLQTDSFDVDYRRMLTAGVKFQETPRNEPYGKVAVFADLYGNHWDLIEQQL